MIAIEITCPCCHQTDRLERIPGYSNAEWNRDLPDAEPGTIDKIEVLRRRVESGLALHQPHDQRTRRHDLDIECEKYEQRNRQEQPCKP